MTRLKPVFIILVFLLPFFAVAGDGFVYLKDTTQKLFFVSNNEVYTPDKGQLLYAQRGNIFFTADNDDKNNISLLVTSLDAAGTKLGMIYEKDAHEPVYSFKGNRFFLGKAGTEEQQQKNELVRIESSKKWLGFYSSDNDSLLAYYRIDSFPSSIAIIVAYTVIKKFGLEKRIGTAQQQQEQQPDQQHHPVTFSFVTPFFGKQQATPPITTDFSTIKPAMGNATANEWMWNGEVLRPRWSLDPDLMWTFDGQTVKHKYADDNNEQYSWDGQTFKPTTTDDQTKQWSWDGRLLQLASDPDGSNQYIVGDGAVKPEFGGHPEKEWHMDGSIPIPLIILIISGIAKTN